MPQPEITPVSRNVTLCGGRVVVVGIQVQGPWVENSSLAVPIAGTYSAHPFLQPAWVRAPPMAFMHFGRITPTRRLTCIFVFSETFSD